MEKTEASAILGIAIEASASEVEEAYDKRMGEVRKRFDAARGMSVRAQCKREFAAIKEARDSLLTELGQIRPTQPMGAGAPVTEQFGEKPPVEEPLEEKPPVAEEPILTEPATAKTVVEQPVVVLNENHPAESPGPTVDISDPLRTGELFASRFEPQSATEVAKRLESGTPQSDIPTPTPTPTAIEFVTTSIPKAQPPVLASPSRKPWLAIVTIIFILGFMSAVVLFLFHYLTEPKPGNLAVNTIPPTPYPEVSAAPSPEASAAPSPEASAAPSPEASVAPSPEASAAPSPEASAAPSPGESAAPPPDLTPTTKEDVIKRINALPGISAEVKAHLIEKLDRARSMERVTVIPFDIGRTVLQRAAADELVKTFDSPKMRDRLSDPTTILVVAGYADNGGRAELNLRISQERAEHVTKILKERAKLRNAMETIGMGGTELLDSKRPGQNRAVEVWAVVPL